MSFDPVHGMRHEVRCQFVVAAVKLQLLLFGRDQCKDLFGMAHRLFHISIVIDQRDVVKCDPVTVTLCIRADSRNAMLQQ